MPGQLRNVIAMLVYTDNHIMSFITCDKTKYYYNNESIKTTMIPFQWKKILIKHSLVFLPHVYNLPLESMAAL